MLALRAFIEDSGDESTFVLSGIIAPVGIWEEVEICWTNVCKSPPSIEYYRTHDAIKCEGSFLNFSEQDRNKKVAELARVIPTDKCYAISVYLPVSEFNDIKDHYADIVEKKFPLWLDRRLLYNDPYFIAASCLSTFIASYDCSLFFPEIITRLKIDLVFHEQGKIGRQFEFFYNNLIRVILPRLENCIYRSHKKFVPLQIADMMASWSRRFTSPKFPIGTSADGYLANVLHKIFKIDRNVFDNFFRKWSQGIKN